ncbi:MAG: ArsR/SmtB family transcription factor [Myxococcota bacterium]
MSKNNSDTFKEQANLLKVLAHEVRLMIIFSLKDREKNVSELLDEIDVEQSTLSKHLSILRMNNIVGDRREGNNIYYKLLTPCAVKFLSCAIDVIKEKKSYLLKSINQL